MRFVRLAIVATAAVLLVTGCGRDERARNDRVCGANGTEDRRHGAGIVANGNYNHCGAGAAASGARAAQWTALSARSRIMGMIALPGQRPAINKYPVAG